MRKIILAATLIAACSVNAANMFTIGADTVRINPNRLGGYWQTPVSMATDAYCDTWNIVFTYPEGMAVKLVAGITPLEGMSIGYVNNIGAFGEYTASLNVSAAYGSIGSTTAGNYGYWDYNYDGVYETYGTVKWEPGTRRLFEFNFYLDPAFRQGDLVMDATFNSSPDQRGAVLMNVRSYRRTHLWVGYELGDVNGSGLVNIGDVTILIEHLLEGSALDEFEAAAGDVNGDGRLNIGDVTALIDKLLIG